MWFVRASPADYVLAMSEMAAGLPLVGRYFQPFGGITAMAADVALKEFVSPERQKVDWPAPDRLAPVLRGVAQRRRYPHRGAVRYGCTPNQVLDVWRRDDLTGPAPVTGLTHDDMDFHVDLPDDADTSVDAVVGIYGRYCREDRSTPERDRFVDFPERVVVKKRQARHPTRSIDAIFRAGQERLSKRQS
jgi:hypothetical protein